MDIRNNAVECLIYTEPRYSLTKTYLMPLFHSADRNVRFNIGVYVAENWPKDAELAGIYQEFPELRGLNDP